MVKQPFLAQGSPVLIGSLPLAEVSQALAWIFSATPRIPLWPQLPGHPLERMLFQFAEGIPCLVEQAPETAAGTIRYDVAYPGFEQAQLAFYEAYLAIQEDPSQLADSCFAISEARAMGFYQLLAQCDTLSASNLAALKGQVTGPFTLLTGVKDQQGRAGYYDETVREMVTKGVAMKGAWQAWMIKEKTGQLPIIFIDEPGLSGLGSSAFISVQGEDINAMLREVAAGIRQGGGLAGVHVCANTDWSILLNAELDILSFDAYDFFDRIAPLAAEVDQFLAQGGILAWGGIPTTRAEVINQESVESLVTLWESQMAAFVTATRTKKDLLQQTLITPSCGTGALDEASATRVLALTQGVSETLRQRYLDSPAMA